MRGRRGYTIMEVGLVTVLSTLLLVGAMRWLVGLGGVVNASLEEAETETLSRAVALFVSDVQGARPCEPTGVDAPISLVSPSLVRMTTVSGGELRSVTWSMSAGQLLRAESVPAADCAYVAPTSWVTWSTSLDMDASLFSGVIGGVVLPLGTDGDCATTFVPRCSLDAVQVEVSSTSDALVIRQTAALS